MSEVPAANNVIFIGNSVSLGRGPANIPLFYPSYNNSAANVIYAANTLPGSPRNFTTTSSAYNWAVTNNFFINNSDNPIPRIDADGLTLYLDANQPTSYPQTSTSVYDLSGRNNNGTLFNNTGWNSNGWFTFDGTDDYINCGNNSSLAIVGDITIYALVYFNSFSGYNGIAGKTSANSVPAPFDYYTNPSNPTFLSFLRGNGSSFTTVNSNQTISLNRWHQIAVTMNGTNVTHYLNGTSNGTGILSTTIGDNGDPLLIGNRGDFFTDMNGNISSVQIYSKALNTSEVKQNYFQSNLVQDGLVFMVDANNLVSYPKSGTAWYNLTGSANGTLTNGPTFGQENGGVISLDGSDDFVDFGTVNFQTSNNITLDIWVNPQTTTPNQYADIFDANHSANGFVLQQDNLNYNYYYFAYWDGSGFQVTSNVYIDPFNWSHIVITKEGNNGKIYKNGQLAISNTFTNPSIQGSNVLNMGKFVAGGRNWQGKYGNFRGYNRALSVDEVLQNYQATQYKFLGQNIVTNGLQLSYDFANKNSYPGTGTTIYDLSGNSNNGTLLNNPQFSPNANGGVISWDGTDDYIDTGKTATQLGFYGANYTMEAWVYPTSLTSDRTMFGTNQSALRQGLHLVFRSGQIYQGHYASDFTAGTVTTNNWYQIVYTYNASTGACEIFKNNVSQGTGTISSFIGTTNILIASWGGSYYFEGPGGIYRIYNRVLSSTEILQNYNAQKTRFGL
jgi:hypothetical protein